MTILLTGASGFVGSALLRCLMTVSGQDVHAIARRKPNSTSQDINWHKCDLMEKESVQHLVETIRPTHVIHAAWETTPGLFWTCESNRNWLSASLNLLDQFEKNGGQRFLFVGSMAEYDWTESPLTENFSPEIPVTLYGETKLCFHRMLMHHASTQKFSAATGRIFNLYGPNEKPERLIPQIFDALTQSKPIKVGSADRQRDILHVDDAARGLLTLLQSEIDGAVNIADGNPIRMGQIFDFIGDLTGRGGLIRTGERPDTAGEPKQLTADASLIRATGWRPLIPIEDGLRDIWTRGETQRAA